MEPKRYRLYIIKPAGMTSTQAIARLGWNDRKQLKRYLIANNLVAAEMHPEQGMIKATLKPLEEGKKK